MLKMRIWTRKSALIQQRTSLGKGDVSWPPLLAGHGAAHREEGVKNASARVSGQCGVVRAKDTIELMNKSPHNFERLVLLCMDSYDSESRRIF